MAEITQKALKSAITAAIEFIDDIYEEPEYRDDLMNSGEPWQEYCAWKAALAALERGEKVKIVP